MLLPASNERMVRAEPHFASSWMMLYFTAFIRQQEVPPVLPLSLSLPIIPPSFTPHKNSKPMIQLCLIRGWLKKWQHLGWGYWYEKRTYLWKISIFSPLYPLPLKTHFWTTTFWKMNIQFEHPPEHPPLKNRLFHPFLFLPLKPHFKAVLIPHSLRSNLGAYKAPVRLKHPCIKGFPRTATKKATRVNVQPYVCKPFASFM